MKRAESGSGRVRDLALFSLLVLPVLGVWPPALQAQSPDRRNGGAAVRLLGPHGPLRGELVAATSGGIWIREEDRGFVLIPMDQIRQVRVERHRWTPRRVMTWTGIAGGLTSVGMMVACNAYDGSDPDCGGFLLRWAAGWAVVGGISSALVSPAWEPMSPRDTDGLRPWARFPQGLPPGFPSAPSDTGTAPGPDSAHAWPAPGQPR